MLERIHSLPYPWVFLFFWCLAMMRSHTMYWIGRGITAGTARSRWVSLLESPVYARAQAWSARWGVLAVPVSFLTVGIQSVIQLSAGVARMPLRRYLPAVIVGCVIWAFIWGTGGVISLVIISQAWEHSPVLTVTGLVVVAVAVTGFNLLGRHRGDQPSKRRDAPLSADCAREP